MFRQRDLATAAAKVEQRYVAPPASETTEVAPDAPGAYRRSPADPANAAAGDNGNRACGRHSALKPMRQLEAADLVCIRIADVSELDWIIERLRAG